MHWLFTLLRASPSKPSREKLGRQLICRVTKASETRDPWEKRIIQLADGKSVEEISRILYLEELRTGAWEADIGLWGNIFDRDVVKTIRALESRGYVHVRNPAATDGEEKFKNDC